MTTPSNPSVDELVAKAFPPWREPRSGAHKAGVGTLLQSRPGRSVASICPFARGSAEYVRFGLASRKAGRSGQPCAQANITRHRQCHCYQDRSTLQQWRQPSGVAVGQVPF